ncbi:MAG: peptidylprolyl isomerase [Patescibacteria group bacterium]
MTKTPTSKEQEIPSAGISGLNPEEKVAARKEILDIIKEANVPNNRPTKKLEPKILKKPIITPKTTAMKMDPIRKMTSEQPHIIEQPNVASAPKPPKQPNTSPRRSLGYVGLALLVIIVLGLGVAAYGFYRLDWSNQISVRVAKAVSLPAVIVNNKLVSYKNYDHDVSALKQYYEKQKAAQPAAVSMPSDQELKTIILDKLVQDEVLSQKAKEMSISITDQEVDNEMQNVITDAGGEELLKQSLSDLYGWGVQDFKTTVLKPYLLRQKIQTKLNSDDGLPANIDAKKRIEDVLALARDPNNKFEDLANKYNEDIASPNGGDLGYLAKQDVVAEFADAAFALEPGQISNVVRSQYGFHIIKLEEKLTSTGKESTTIPAGVETVHVRHILIKTQDIDSWLKEKVDDSKVYRLLK